MTIKRLSSILIGLLPVVMIFRVPFTGIGFSTLFVFALTLLAVLHVGFKGWKIRPCIPLILFFGYILIRNFGNGALPLLYLMAFMVVLTCYNGLIDIYITLDVIDKVTILASVIVLVQSLMHYLFGINIPALFNSFLLEEYAGISGVRITSGIFRPSGFFLEPAHFAQYSIIAVLYNISKEKIRVPVLAMISLAMLLSTSGIGLLLLAGSFIYLLFIKTRSIKKERRIQYFIILFVSLVLLMIVVSRVSYVQLALQRVFSTDSSGYNAISGRTAKWSSTVGSLSFNRLILGIGPKINKISGFMTGLNEILYYYGIVGLILLIVSIFTFFIERIKEKDWRFVLCVVYLGLIMSSDVVGFIILAFWYSLIASKRNNVNANE